MKFEFLEDCSFPAGSLLGCVWTMYQVPTKESKVKIDDAPKEYSYVTSDIGRKPIPQIYNDDSSCPGYLDEIALLNRGKITKDAPRNPYRRYGWSKEVATPVTQQKGPISFEELRQRGYIDGNGKHRTIKSSKRCAIERQLEETVRESGSTVEVMPEEPRNNRHMTLLFAKGSDSGLSAMKMALMTDLICSDGANVPSINERNYKFDERGHIVGGMKVEDLQDGGIRYTSETKGSATMLQHSQKMTFLFVHNK